MPVLLFILFSLPLIITIALIVHAIKTGRDRVWIFVMIFFPMAGALVYFLLEILPELLGHPRVRATGRALARQATAGSRLKRLERELELSSTFANRRALADEYRDQGVHDQAIRHYTACLTGFDADSREVNFALAQCYFETAQYDLARQVLEKLKTIDGRLKKYETDLLWARVLEKAGLKDQADAAYAAVAPQYPGFEGYARYGIFLKNNGDYAGARRQFDTILHLAKTQPRVNRRTEGVWIRKARSERTGLQGADEKGHT